MSIPDLGTMLRLSEIRQGDLVRVRSVHTFYGRSIRRAVGSWANHDAMICRWNGHWYVGDAIYPRAQLTPLGELLRDVVEGRAEVRFARPWDATIEQGERAACWWIKNVCGSWYDVWAILRLLPKALIGDLFPWPAGWEFAWYCTEGVRQAWVEATKGEHLPRGYDYWGKANATPRTTEKRVADERLIDRTAKIVQASWLSTSVDGQLALRAP